MVDCVKFTDIKICDLNGNNLYDPKIDRVTDGEGHDLPSADKSRRLKEVLKQIGASGWKGILLSEAAQYLEKLNHAEEYSYLGEVDATRDALLEAREAARKLPIPFLENRLKSILKQTLIGGIETHFDRALQLAKKGGDISEVKTSLDTAVRLIREFNQTFPKKIPLDFSHNRRILKEAYQNGIPKMFKEIEIFAYLGRATVAELYWDLFSLHLSDAKKKFGLTFSYHPDQFISLMKGAYPLQISQEWTRARQLASSGQTFRTRSKLKFIENLIQQGNRFYGLGLRFSQIKAEDILEVALLKGVEDNFRIAERFAKQGKAGDAQTWLDNAQDYVNEYNQKFSNKPGRTKAYFEHYRATEILQCARRTGPCP